MRFIRTLLALYVNHRTSIKTLVCQKTDIQQCLCSYACKKQINYTGFGLAVGVGGYTHSHVRREGPRLPLPDLRPLFIYLFIMII